MFDHTEEVPAVDTIDSLRPKSSEASIALAQLPQSSGPGDE